MAAAVKDGENGAELPSSPDGASAPEVTLDDAIRPTDSMISIRLSDANATTPAPMQTPEAIIVEEHIDTPLEERGDGSPLETQAASVSGAVLCTEPEEAEEAPEAEISHRTTTPHDQRKDQELQGELSPEDHTMRVRCSSRTGTEASEGSGGVDWDELEKTEEQEPRDEGSDESTAFLLARLEQENDALAIDPKANLRKTEETTTRPRSQSRPPSIHHLKKLVNEPAPSSLRYSLLPSPPPMTDLEFYAALVVDFPRTAQHLPTLLSKKIRAGVPPPLRGVVWVSMAGARDTFIEERYDKLSGEPSPYENLIGKDIGRSFPGVEMFRDPNGDGQKMLGRVLKSFSLYDPKIGYCQGLGFLVGPLLMHMGEKEAFCVLVRLMEHYDLRSCFLPDLAGLHLRIYQYQQLLAQHLPSLSSHLKTLQIEPGYVSQWFLSFFAVTCPLPMLLRIYDVILAEGASETLMRVALSLMRRNETKILACTEYEDVMQLLLSRGLWDVYNCNADDLVNDFVSFTGVVTNESLQSLGTSFKEAKPSEVTAKVGSLPEMQATASRILGRLWAGSNTTSKSVSLSPGTSDPSRPNSFLRRTPSKQSMASTLNSFEGSSSEGTASTVPTEASNISRQTSTDCVPAKALSPVATSSTTKGGSKDRDLHVQIEDLLTAISEMQRDQSVLTNELQREREEREEDRKVVTLMIDRFRQKSSLETGPEQAVAEGKTAAADSPAETVPHETEAEGKAIPAESTAETIPEQAETEAKTTSAESPAEPVQPSDESDEMDDLFNVFEALEEVMVLVEERFVNQPDPKRSSIVETKRQLRDELKRSQESYDAEAGRSRDLGRQVSEQEKEITTLKEQLKETRARVQDGHREKQRLEKSVQEIRSRQSSTSLATGAEESTTPTMVSSDAEMFNPRASIHGGLREFKLNRSSTSPALSKRTSSLQIQPVTTLMKDGAPSPRNDESLLLELVNSKTAEAVAKQEAEELRGKLDSLRKMLKGNLNAVTSAPSPGHRSNASQPVLPQTERSATTSSPSSASPTSKAESSSRGGSPSAHGPAASISSFWGGWGKRTVSTTIPEATQT